ncbi:hypothetical protein SETIT_5G050400v2 [Setaria italica]|uniref:Peptidase S1 domain-containing protein n=1 Tax=Setaria italica TaxID=4555 RepID=A0A368R381_SETIT|nr:hypothetical protein SETIT_5G050400v2 [Setaria italica]
MSVVRLCIARTKKNKGRGTGFIVVNTANKLVVMTCGHLLNEWVRGTKVGVTFHDMRDASAKAVWVNTEKEVALLLIDTPSNPEFSTGDFGNGLGAFGSPVFEVDGWVVGISISGVQDMTYVLSVGWIWETLLKAGCRIIWR